MYKYKASLHCHSIFSPLDGLAKLSEIADKAEEFKLSGVAITDHGNLYGAYKWSKLGKDRSFKAIVGSEVYFVDNDLDIKEKGERKYHLTLLANGRDGFLDLTALSSNAATKGFYGKPRVNFESLSRWNRHKKIICLSGCLGSLISQMIVQDKEEKDIMKEITKFQNIFGKENFYLEIHPPQSDLPDIEKVSRVLSRLSRQYGIPIVAANDSHYINKDDKEAHDLLLCINMKKKLDDEERFKIKGDYWFKDPETMENEMSLYPEALEETGKIVEKIDVNYFPKHDPYMPTIKGEIGSGTHVERICTTMLEKHFETINAYDEIKEIYKKRLKMELGVLNKYSIFDYFMVLKTIVDFARDSDIYVGPGRGSAAGSLVSYLLGITGVDPLEYNLLFERFLNEGRLETGSLPDIDLDFEANRRNEIYEFIRNYFGKSRTCNIITFSYLKDKSAIKDTAKAMGIEFHVINELVKEIKDDFSFDEIDKYPKLLELSVRYPKLFALARKVKGTIRQVGLHAAGLIISPEVLTNIIPVTSVKNKITGERHIASQFDMKDVESLGLIKIDVLGSSTQTQIHNTIKLIKANHDTEIDISKIPLDDEKVYSEIFCKINTMGIFQCSKPAVRRALVHIQPKNIEDISSLNALVRPGAKEFIELFSTNKENTSKIEYIDDSLEPILKDTYGIILYQEQIMEIVKVYAGFSAAESDNIRRGIGKKIVEIINSYRDKFVKGALLNGHDEEKANNVFNVFVAFGEYGFNRSHSICYSLIGYQTAWLKYNYPEEFYASLLNTELMDGKKIEEEKFEFLQNIVNELRDTGRELLPPDVNKSNDKFSVEGNNIRYGIAGIKGIGRTPSKAICDVRASKGNFIDFVDFLMKTKDSGINKSVIVGLTMTSAFNKISPYQFDIMQKFESIKKDIDKNHNSNEQTFNFIENTDSSYELGSSKLSYEKGQVLEKEKSLSGMYITGHPLDEHMASFLKMKFNSLHMIDAKEKDDVTIIAAVEKIITTITKRKKEEMCFMDCYDLYGKINVTIFPKNYKEFKSIVKEGSILSISGPINIFGDKKSLIANKIYPFK